MEQVYTDFEKVIFSKVEEFSLLLLQFQQLFPNQDITNIINKKNELLNCCSNNLDEEYSFNSSTNILKRTNTDLRHLQSITLMHNKAKELDKLFLEFLDKFIQNYLSK